tara:strand:+ start:9232 stop:10404 length:1173 start_codon:yes stop_codon:yes gene_type:complete
LINIRRPTDSELNDDGAVESEDTSSEGSQLKPWDPMEIRITTKNFTVREVYIQMVEKEIDLAPDFQRDFVWKVQQQTRLIESILLGIPLPAFYFSQDELGQYDVIDGVQRLTTIKQFMSGQLLLEERHLEYLSPASGNTYDTLDNATRRRFASTQIVAHVIEPQTPSAVKYDIFNRVNTGGSPLSPQELRHCMSKERSRLLLRSMVELSSFDSATDQTFWRKGADGNLERFNRRMVDREMALRFCAFRNFSAKEYSEAGSLDAYLLIFTQRIDSADDPLWESNSLARLESDFNTAMINCREVFGNMAFRVTQKSGRRTPINRALFEAQALAFADHDPHKVRRCKDELREKFADLLADDEFSASVRSGTGALRNVEIRLNRARALVTEVIR